MEVFLYLMNWNYKMAQLAAELRVCVRARAVASPQKSFSFKILKFYHVYPLKLSFTPSQKVSF